jgi:hypothetical protein
MHLYLLIGQSNMAGRGQIESQDKAPHRRVYMFDAADQWAFAVDPLHFDKPIAGVGPGLAFGKSMAARTPSTIIGLIPCAAGGSPITTWRPGAYWHQTDSYPYDDAIRRACLAQQDGALKGFLWHQGESDANSKDASRYMERLVTLIQRLRSDLDTDAPFVCAALGDFFVARNEWASTINDTLEQLPTQVPQTVCVPATGLGHNGDDLHFSAQAARELGKRYAQAILHLQQISHHSSPCTPDG